MSEPNQTNPDQGDPVFRPPHYTRFPIEPITFIAANDLPFLPGNAIKYICRAPYKENFEQDIRKAIRCLEMYLEDWKRKKSGLVTTKTL